MKAYRGIGGVKSLILNLGTRRGNLTASRPGRKEYEAGWAPEPVRTC